MSLIKITGPATEPVTLAEAKLHCKVDTDLTADDALITTLIQAAREQAESQLERSLITQTWERVIDVFPLVEIELGVPHVQSITSVTYIDTSGVTQTLSSAAYVIDADFDPGWLLPAYGYEWPSTFDTANAVRVRFVAGYGAANAMPAGIKSWILLRIGTLYKFREEIVSGTSVDALPNGFTDRLLDPYRVVWA